MPSLRNLGNEEEPIQLLDSFISHWKGITNYYIVTTDETLPVKQTDIPWRLRQMVDILIYEEKQMERGETGPCMEYLLQHKILETLCTLAKAGYPPGMKQQVLLLITKLLGQIQQPMLPHINVHRPVQKLIRLCGEDLGSKTEKEEVQFLTTVCAKLSQDPYLINFFIEKKDSADSRKLLPCSVEKGEGQPKDAVRTSSLAAGVSPSPSDRSPVTSAPSTHLGPHGMDGQPDKSLVNALLTLTASEKNQLALKACEGLLLLATLPEEGAAWYMVESTALCQTLADRLSDLYRLIPDSVDPGQVESLGRVNWRSHYAASNVEDAESFPGKKAVASFFSWLDYCNQLVKEAHKVTAAAMAQEIRRRFFVTVLEPQLLQVFLCLVPDTVKTSHLVAGCGYDTYLVDAHRMFQGCCVNAKDWKWPHVPSNVESCDSGGLFYEGHFLKVLFDRMAQILDQPYDLNLQVTSVISKVALFPHPHLHEYLLDPYINLIPSCRSLFSIIVRVIGDLMQRIQRIPQFPSKLLLVRRQLIGLEPESMVDHVTILKGVIVLEEFCKELAAISFVKYPSEPD
ncbi:hypothetical protein chiPu_0019330 [Chiloscyllium punctatum]|uniref:FHF complex subunit HOOK-interacting protein C-terminal domain-containing protein n=1 Tax=Chiloscyllium punctatum TaxID=137246 RepID=A0A401RRK1_CHIPU|nr:hypothetical protein [Chiloscyllium punctatum]